MRTSTAVLFALAFGIASLCEAAVENKLQVIVTPTRITVDGVTPNAKVLFFGAGFEPKRDNAVVHRWSTVLSDTAVRGHVEYDLGAPVTWNALWIIVDLTSGHYAIASTPGFPTIRTSVPHREFKRGIGSLVSRFAYGRSAVYALYVHPGGASMAMSRDGGPTDSDGVADGTTEIDLANLQPLADGVKVPDAFVPGGTLFLIDTSRLDLLELQIDGSLLAGAH
jgi:hypothetical protein